MWPFILWVILVNFISADFFHFDIVSLLALIFDGALLFRTTFIPSDKEFAAVVYLGPVDYRAAGVPWNPISVNIGARP